MPVPRETIADRLISARFVVFARQSSSAPFQFAAQEVVKGTAGGKAIDLFVDSTIRRQLATDTSRRAVLVRKESSPGWALLGVADRDYQRVIRRILVFAKEWQAKGGHEKRCRYFLTLLGHSNRAIFELAYLELGRAPYSMIQAVGRAMKRSDLEPLLKRREYLEWRPLAILLLAQSGQASDTALIAKSFDACQRLSSTRNLAAWTAAYLEVRPTEAMDRIRIHYLQNSTRTPDELAAVHEAIGVHQKRSARQGSESGKQQVQVRAP